MKKVEAFVTLEYSLLLPVLCLLYTVLIYVGLYQYNQCLFQNDMYHIAIDGAGVTYQNKYILAEDMQIDYSQRGNKISIKGKGKMRSPIFFMGIGEEYWYFQSDLEVWQHSPTNVLRLCKEIFDER